MPKISVLLPVYNENPAFLDEAIQSILAQTVQDFELLLLDDGSDAATAAHLSAWITRDPRIRVLHFPHRGVTKTLNHGIREARGQFIARMDGDDIALPHRFEKQIAFLENNLGHALCGSFVQFINEQGEGSWIKEYPTDHEDIKYGLVAHNRFTHAALMFRVAELRALRGYNETLATAQDYDLVLRAARHYKVANIPEVLLKYRYRDASVSWKKHGKQQERDAIRIRWRAIHEYGYPRTHLFSLIRPLVMYAVPKSVKFMIRKRMWETVSVSSRKREALSGIQKPIKLDPGSRPDNSGLTRDDKRGFKSLAYKILKQRGPLPRYRDTFSCDAVITFVDSLRAPFEPFGQWRLAPSNPAPSRFASCFAYFILQELNALNYYTKEQRAAWMQYIKGWQREEDGLFHELEEGSKTHDVEYIALQLTSFALEILRAEGEMPAHPIKWLDTISFPTWLYQRNFSDPWKEGNRILFVGELLLHCHPERSEGSHTNRMGSFAQGAQDDRHRRMLNQMIFWLDETVNPQTGFWGSGDLYPAMLGAYHQYILYKKLNRRPPYIHTAITNTLDLQWTDGLFRRYGYGGACEDMDAIEILKQGYPFVDARTQERISGKAAPRSPVRLCRRPGSAGQNVFNTVHTKLTAMQREDGGFAYNPYITLTYSGIPLLACAKGESDLFSTWFRLKTIARLGP